VLSQAGLADELLPKFFGVSQRKAMQHLTNIFPSDDLQNREVWREYVPHATRVNRNGQDADSGIGGELCLQVGRCLRADGRIGDVVQWLEESRDLRANLAKDDPARLVSQ
jgi:hypothetical protein